MLANPMDRLAALNRPGASLKEKPHLEIGSDVEIAGRVREDLERAFGDIIHAEGTFWRYEQTCWCPIPAPELRLAAHDYDGAFFKTPSGEPSGVKLSKSRITANATGIEYRRFRDGRFFLGMVLTTAGDASPYDRDASVTHE